MQEIQRENLEETRYSEGINKKESNLSLAYSRLNLFEQPVQALFEQMMSIK